MKKAVLFLVLSSAVAYTSCNKSDSAPRAVPAVSTFPATGFFTDPQTGQIRPISGTAVTSMARVIPIHCGGPGWSIDGWIDSETGHGRLVWIIDGRPGGINWLNAITDDHPKPFVLSSLKNAQADPDEFNRTFDQYYEVHVTDANNDPTTMAALGLSYSDVVLPAWQASLDGGQ